MASKTWLAIVLSLLVWFVYARWFGPPPEPVKPPAAAGQPTVPPTSAPSEVVASTETSTIVSASPFAVSFPKSQIEVLKDKAIEVSFSAAGAKIQEVRLLGYQKSIKQNAGHVTPINPTDTPLALATLFTDESLASFSQGVYEKASSTGDAVQYQRVAQGITVTKEFW